MMPMCDTCDLDQLAASVVEEDTAPVAAVGWACVRADGSIRVESGGATRRLFDLASVSKPFTAVALARSGLDRRRALGEILPELADTASAPASIEHLLSHRAGLEAHLELFAPLREGAPCIDPRAALRIAADARRADCTGPIPIEGFDAVYSDLGYILAGEALARHLQVADAGAAVERLLVSPLALEGQLGTVRTLGGDAAYVPTETTSWRSPEPLCGIVHDENAWALSGLGGSGHAGLFGTVGALLAFGLDVLRSAPGWLTRPRAGSSWRAGFDGKSEHGSSAGSFASPSSYGHLGFTGTSLWIDPARRLVTCLLCNRVAPSRHRIPAAGGIKTTRPRVHEALFRAADASRF